MSGSAGPRRALSERGGTPSSLRAIHDDTTGGSRHRHADSVSVVLGELDPVVALGLTRLLRADRRLCLLRCDPARSALEGAVARCGPRVVVLGETAEPTIVERLRSISPQTGVLVLSHDPTWGAAMGLLAVGANCVSRSAQDVDLVGAIHRTARGERFFVASDGSLITRRYPPGAERLTDREREVLAYLARGALYSMIAVELDISVRTAEKHAASLFRKLGVRGKHDLIGMPVPSESAGSPSPLYRGS
jgi:DNA-binding NarL/FixJ family response regulator